MHDHDPRHHWCEILERRSRSSQLPSDMPACHLQLLMPDESRGRAGGQNTQRRRRTSARGCCRRSPATRPSALAASHTCKEAGARLVITLSTLIGACARDTLWATHLVLHRFESGFSHMKALRRAIEATQSSSSQLSSARLGRR